MLNKRKRWLIAAVMCVSAALLMTGCDKLKKTETEKVTEKVTEVVTEAPTETETESETQTESETEPPTESETETETQSETQPETMTLEEEQAQETVYSTLKIMYAADDINVREAPDTTDSSNIFDSFDQGEQLTVVGETPNWYKVEVEGYDIYGYVAKKFVSESEVEAKTESERAAEASTAGDTASGTSETTSDTSAVDLEYGVESYAEEFTIRATAGANMRSTPSQDGEIINTIASDTEVTAIGYTDRWYKISYNGTIGYVNKNLFTAE